MQSYRELDVWQKAMDLVEATYRLTANLPKEELYGLTNQLRRAAISVPANIAEGYSRTHRGDYLRHLSIAKGSLAEWETLVAIALRLGFIAREELQPLWTVSQDIGMMLTKLIAALNKKEKLSAEDH